MPLLRRSAGVDSAIAHSDALPSFDVHSPLLSLPGIFQTSAATIPAEAVYLSAEPTLIEALRSRLAADRLVHIGLFWRGNRDHYEDAFRSIPLECMTPLFAVAG